MNPTEPARDLMRRTMVNLRFIEAHQASDGPYEVTQLINSFLGALAHPWERYRTDLQRLPLAEAGRLGWPEMEKELTEDVDPNSLGDLLRLVRNAFAHGNIEFIPDSSGDIQQIRFWNNNRSGRRTWGAVLTVSGSASISGKFCSPGRRVFARREVTETDALH
jgi:hypothetical protein